MLQRRIRGAFDETAEATQPDGDRLPHGKVAVTPERLDEPEEVRRGEPARDDGVPSVVDQVVALDHRELRQGVAAETIAQRVVVGDAHESVAAGVDDDRGICRRQGDTGLRRVEQQLRFHTVDLEVDRNGEQRGIVGVDVGEPLLVEHQVGALEPGRDQRIAGLPDPRIHQCADGDGGVGLLDCVPQVAGLGVSVGVLLQVQADPLSEALGAQVLLEHAQQ